MTNEDKRRPPRFLLAMPDDLRGMIEREAAVNGRTVTAEINLRLRETFATRVSALPPSYMEPNRVTVSFSPPEGQSANDFSRPLGLSSTDQAMLEVFRKMPPEKQLALLSLFK